eukprot:COSAG06_NODE_62221_length_265_cov_1.240964_1_plen_82_part_01
MVVLSEPPDTPVFALHQRMFATARGLYDKLVLKEFCVLCRTLASNGPLPKAELTVSIQSERVQGPLARDDKAMLVPTCYLNG